MLKCGDRYGEVSGERYGEDGGERYGEGGGGDGRYGGDRMMKEGVRGRCCRSGKEGVGGRRW